MFSLRGSVSTSQRAPGSMAWGCYPAGLNGEPSNGPEGQGRSSAGCAGIADLFEETIVNSAEGFVKRKKWRIDAPGRARFTGTCSALVSKRLAWCSCIQAS